MSTEKSVLKKTEHAVEFTLLAARWLLLPLYAMLMAILVVFAISSGRELWHLFEHATSVKETDLVLSALALIDLSLVAGLLVMVALSGYESFVSRFDHREDAEKPDWLGKLDLGTVKMKLASSIVAISGINLLKKYMAEDKYDQDKLITLAAIHIVFVVSALLLALVDKIAFSDHH